MTESVEIRESTPDDLVAIESLYPEAFPDEDLLPLVRELLGDLTVVGVFRRTAGGRRAGDDKRNRRARHSPANHGGVVGV